jgi:hypothetical protein
MSRQAEIDRLRAEIDSLRAERDSASERIETLRKVAFEPDIFLIAKHRATSEMSNDELRKELVDFGESCEGLLEQKELIERLELVRSQILPVPSLASFLENASPKLKGLIADAKAKSLEEGELKSRKGVVNGKLVTIPTVELPIMWTVELPIMCSDQAVKQLSAFTCTGSGKVDDLACAVDLLRLAAALELEGLAEVASEFLSGKDGLGKASMAQLLQIFDAYHILERPKDAVLKAMKGSVAMVLPRNLDVSHLSAGAMACLLAELPPDVSSTQDAVTTVFKVPMCKGDMWSFVGISGKDFRGPTVVVGTGPDGKPVRMRTHIEINTGEGQGKTKLGVFSQPLDGVSKTLVSVIHGLVHPTHVATAVAARIQPDSGAERLVTAQLSCVPAAILPATLRCKWLQNSAFFANDFGWGNSNCLTPALADGGEESQLFMPDGSEPNRGHLIVQSTYQLKAHSTSLALLKKWATAQGYEGDSLSEMLEFCTSRYKTIFDSVLLHHAAAQFMSLSAEPAFERLSPDVLLELLSRDDIESSDEAAVLKALAPWFRNHDAQDVARVLKKVMLHEVPTSVLRGCFSSGGVLHAFRTESAVQVVLADALAAQLHSAKRQREGPNSHINHPDEFLCPITYELMEDPVVCADGHTYERAAVTEWLATHDRSPKCNTVLEHKFLIPNHSMRKQIMEYRDRNAATSARMSKRCKRMGSEAPAAPSFGSVVMELLEH